MKVAKRMAITPIHTSRPRIQRNDENDEPEQKDHDMFAMDRYLRSTARVAAGEVSPVEAVAEIESA